MIPLKGGENIKILNFLEKFVPKKIRVGGKNLVVSSGHEEVYFKALAMHIAISYLAGGFSKCEFKVYENNQEIKNKDYFTFNLSPNINESGTQFWYRVIETMYYKNECLVIPLKEQLYIADSYNTEEFATKGNVYTNIQVGKETIDKTFKADEIFLFKLENEDVASLIEDMYSPLSKIISHAFTQYKALNTEKYKLKVSQVKAGDEEFEQEFEEIIQEQVKAFLNSEKAVYTEFDGYELSSITNVAKVGNKDAKDILDLKKSIFETIAQALKIPKGLLEGNITNINDITKILITFAIDPLAATVEQELTRKQGYDNWSKGNYIKTDTSKINHIDILEVAEKVDKLISSGTMCVNEVREIIGKQPLDSDFGKTHFMTKNYETSEQALKGDDENKQITNKVQVQSTSE